MRKSSKYSQNSIDLGSKKAQTLDFMSNNDLNKLINVLEKHFKEKETTQKQDITTTKESELQIPLSIFSTKISPATALVKYLKQEKGLTYAEISELINRDQRTVWTLCNKYKGKISFVINKKYLLPVNIFQNRHLSVLENIVSYIVSKYNLNPKQISVLLNKNISTIYSVISRIKTKNQKSRFIKIKP